MELEDRLFSAEAAMRQNELAVQDSNEHGYALHEALKAEMDERLPDPLPILAVTFILSPII